MAENSPHANILNRINSQIAKFQELHDDPDTNDRRKQFYQRRIERLNKKNLLGKRARCLLGGGFF